MQKKIRLSIATALLVTTSSYGQLVEDLGMITVTSATKSEQSIKDVTSNVEVITGAELEEKHITTVLDALRLGGISIAQSGGIGQQSSFFLNGFKSGHTLVLIDGIKYNDPTTPEGQAQLEHLMISDIAQIEIIKGAQSGIWGANAVAGVINIITKKATKELITNANIEFGSNNTKKAGANISQKVEKFSYFLGANYISTDGISAQTPRGKNSEDYEADGYTNKVINGKFGFELSDSDEIKFNITDIDTKVEYDNDPSLTATIEQKANNNAYQLTQKNRLYKTSYKHNFNDRDYLSASYAKTTFKKDDPLGSTPKFEGQNSESSIDTKLGYLENSFLLFGATKQSSEDEINKKELDSSGYYITNSNAFGGFILTESLRHDRYNLFDDKTTGKIGAKYNFSDDISLSGNYGTSYKVPSIDQLYGKYWSSWTNSWVVYGDKDLNPETTKSKDISITYKHIKATYFYNEITDLIGSDSNYNYTQVEGTSKIKGYEINYQDEVVSSLLVGANYKKQSAKDKDGKDLQRRIQEELKFGIDYYGFEKIHLGLIGNYVGERYDDLAKTKQTGKYTLINTVANYDVLKNLKTYLKIDNLTDKLYQEVDGYGTTGRTFTVGINATF